MAGLTISPELNKQRERKQQPTPPREPQASPQATRRVLIVVGLAGMLAAWSAASWLLWQQWQSFNRVGEVLPAGLHMAGIPVSGLARPEAEARLASVYQQQPVMLSYADEVIVMPGSALGVTIDFDAMFAQVAWPTAPDVRTDRFWAYLMGEQSRQDENIPLVATYSDEAIRAFLDDVSARYDVPSLPAYADSNNMVTVVGSPGYRLDVEASLPGIAAVALNPDAAARQATLVSSLQPAAQPTMAMLQDQLISRVQAEATTDGLFSIYLLDLASDEKLHMNLLDGTTQIATAPDVAYSGMSIMKIVLMTEFYRQVGAAGALPYELDLVELSITESSNWTSNLLINWIGDLDDGAGLYRINETLTALGMESTFMGGLYDTEDAPGFRFTPANTREDIQTFPDAYMQTTPSDMGMLLEGVYRCANEGTGLLIDTLPGQWTPDECEAMLGYLTSNKIGVLVEAGVPEGTPVAHKHAWGDGNTIGDASIVFSPGGDYVLVYYVWRPEYAYWEPNSALLADISKAIYHYFNPVVIE